MDRLVLSDAAWERMAPLIIGRPDQKGSTGRDNRMFVEGVLWIVRTGSPWRDLPEAFGDWNSVFRRFSRWSIIDLTRRPFLTQHNGTTLIVAHDVERVLADIDTAPQERARRRSPKDSFVFVVGMKGPDVRTEPQRFDGCERMQ